MHDSKALFPSQFHPRYYATVADKRGWTVLWHRSQRCPCLGADRQPNPDCAVCDGLGFSLTEGIETKVTVADNTRRREFLQVGSVEEGEIRFSIAPYLWDHSRLPFVLAENPAYEAAEGDVIVALHTVNKPIVMTQSVVLERGRRDRLRSHYPIKVIKVEALRGSGSEAEKIELIEGADFRIGADGRTFV